ncbi:hypothetical protein CHS0354_021036 [Potamilus streckersoni]|uniref:Uncharacterized protein n=1 Tax=Potamilus streckersoni TaxID=2493646 RepID=A0AAE0SCV9_9BIVA|nr:hypothetical protein CHS0354_021036 [Potamilus streckersoni]
MGFEERLKSRPWSKLENNRIMIKVDKQNLETMPEFFKIKGLVVQRWFHNCHIIRPCSICGRKGHKKFDCARANMQRQQSYANIARNENIIGDVCDDNIKEKEQEIDTNINEQENEDIDKNQESNDTTEALPEDKTTSTGPVETSRQAITPTKNETNKNPPTTSKGKRKGTKRGLSLSLKL